MFISGLHIGWGIWRLFFNEPWMATQPRPLFIFTKMSWYVTAILGKDINELYLLNGICPSRRVKAL